MRLIFHIGAGKTGSTSIQSTLKRNDEELKKQGVWYLGLMLENVETVQYAWQRKSSVVQDFHSLLPKDAKEQLLNVLHPIIEEAKANNIKTLIWSNESFLGGNHNFVPALKQLQREGIRVDLLIYVRIYLSWIRSAYVQWGVKHKTYLGNLKNFKDWSKTNKPSFYKQMENLINVMPKSIYVHNMNAVSDVVEDFLSFAGVEQENIKIYRDNDAPQNEELLLRALFNAQHKEQVLPSVYEEATNYRGAYAKLPNEYLEELMTLSEEDIKGLQAEMSEDQQMLNELLEKQGQTLLAEKGYKNKSTEINSEKLLLALAQITMIQANKILNLENEILQLKIKKEIEDE